MQESVLVVVVKLAPDARFLNLGELKRSRPGVALGVLAILREHCLDFKFDSAVE